MARARVGDGEEKGVGTLQGATRLAKDRKAFRIWLIQLDAWKGNDGLEEEEEDEEEEDDNEEEEDDNEEEEDDNEEEEEEGGGGD